MRALAFSLLAAGLLSGAVAAIASAESFPAPVIIDHTCTNLEAIPPNAIQAAQDLCKWHYARQSHGRQITEGLAIIEAADPLYAAIWMADELPTEPDMLCIYTDGAYPNNYWLDSGIDVTRGILIENPALNISAYAWCTELNSASESYVAQYLTAMHTLESEYPNVTFVYFTGTAEYDGAYGYNRSLRNKQIRDFCLANNKILYDFEDLDSWWFNPDIGAWERSTYEYNGSIVPVEHPELAGDDAEHTSYESCEQKGRAAWWMMTVLAGWSATTAVGEDESEDSAPNLLAYKGFELSCHPNPCNPSTTISFTLPAARHASLMIYDTQGRLVRMLVDGTLPEGAHSIVWNGTNDAGVRVASGVYLTRIRADKDSAVGKILLIK